MAGSFLADNVSQLVATDKAPPWRWSARHKILIGLDFGQMRTVVRGVPAESRLLPNAAESFWRLRRAFVLVLARGTTHPLEPQREKSQAGAHIARQGLSLKNLLSCFSDVIGGGFLVQDERAG